MSTYLSALIPSSVSAWYNLADVTAAGNVSTVKDVSGNGRDLAGPASNKPTYVLNAVGTKPAIRFSGSDDPLTFTPAGSATMKIQDSVLLCKYAPASGSVFADYNGLISNTGSADPILIGGSGTANFYDFDPPAPADNEYRKDWTFYAENAMAAPINTFGVIQYGRTYADTFTSSIGLQIGKDRNLAARTWKGDIAEMMFFSTQLTANERRAVKLYFDLKFNRWLTDTTHLEFPDPSLTGIRWARFYAEPTGWDGVKVEHKYEDEGITLSHTTDTPPRRWQISFTGLTPEEAEVFDAFNDTARRTRTFDFTDKYGTTHTGVRITGYDRSHDAHKSWSNTVEFKLAKYY